MWNLTNVQRTVKDLYDWQETHPHAGSPRYLLSDFTSSVDMQNDFWSEYRTNHSMYDWFFARRYKNFRYYGQDIEGDNPVEDVYEDFVNEIKIFLRINDKKYSELYKIEKMNNTISPTGDYNITETYTGSRSIDTEYVSGAREDESEYVSGSRQDSSSYVKGAESTQRVDSTKAFNSTTFVEVDKSVTDTGSRSDSETSSKGQQTDTSTLNKGEQTNTEEKNYTDSHSVNTNGTQTNPSENLEKYKQAWSSFSFYSMIFDDICKALLLV